MHNVVLYFKFRSYLPIYLYKIYDEISSYMLFNLSNPTLQWAWVIQHGLSGPPYLTTLSPWSVQESRFWNVPISPSLFSPYPLGSFRLFVSLLWVSSLHGCPSFCSTLNRAGLGWEVRSMVFCIICVIQSKCKADFHWAYLFFFSGLK